jgi:hypothetical protein
LGKSQCFGPPIDQIEPSPAASAFHIFRRIVRTTEQIIEVSSSEAKELNVILLTYELRIAIIKDIETWSASDIWIGIEILVRATVWSNGRCIAPKKTEKRDQDLTTDWRWYSSINSVRGRSQRNSTKGGTGRLINLK